MYLARSKLEGGGGRGEGADAYSRGNEKATSSISRMKKATFQRAHTFYDAQPVERWDWYNAGLNAYQLKKCFDVGLRRMYRLYCIQNFFSPLLNCPSRKIRISVAPRRNINNFSKGETVNIQIIGETFFRFMESDDRKKVGKRVK